MLCSWQTHTHTHTHTHTPHTHTTHTHTHTPHTHTPHTHTHPPRTHTHTHTHTFLPRKERRLSQSTSRIRENAAESTTRNWQAVRCRRPQFQTDNSLSSEIIYLVKPICLKQITSLESRSRYCPAWPRRVGHETLKSWNQVPHSYKATDIITVLCVLISTYLGIKSKDKIFWT